MQARSLVPALAALVVFAAACWKTVGEDVICPATTSTANGGSGGVGGAGGGLVGGGGAGGDSPCIADAVCVTELPYHGAGDTTQAGPSLFDSYACAPTIDESGPEIVYDVLVPQAGTLTVTIGDGGPIDIDPHILASLKDGTCLARANTTATAVVDAGHVYVVADTYVSGGVPQSGAFTIDITWAP